jgi:dienelactone hydrolase
MVDRRAAAGYAAVAPDLYHRLGPGVERSIQQLKDPEIVADVQATVDFLQHHNAIDSGY